MSLREVDDTEHPEATHVSVNSVPRRVSGVEGVNGGEIRHDSAPDRYAEIRN